MENTILLRKYAFAVWHKSLSCAKPASFFLLMCIFGQLQSQTNSQEKKQRIEQNAAIGKENLKEFFSLLFFDAASAAEFNIVTDNGLAEFVGNRKLRQTIDFFKDQKLTGVCVRCYIDSDQRWAKMLNFKTPEGNCDTTDGGHSLIFDIALQPLSEGKGAKYKPVITYRAYPNGEYNRTIKSDDIKKFEEYMKNDSSNLMLTNSEFIPKLNDIILTALLRLMGSDAVPVVVELTPKDKSLAYDSCVSSATQQYYQQINLHGKTTYARWVSIEKGKSLEVEGKITKMLPDTSQESNMQLQLKRNESKLIEYSSGDTAFVYSVPGISNKNSSVKVEYNTTGNKGLNVLAGQLGVAAYKKETPKIVIVPVGVTISQTNKQIQEQLDAIYKHAIIEWDVTLAPTFSHDKNISINRDANHKDPYDKSMQELITAYKSHIKSKTYYIFVIAEFSNESGSAAATGYMPYQQRYGFVTMKSEDLVRTIAHELGHGAFGLEHTFDPEYGIDDRYNNLMGYGKGDTARLFKFQWDIAHNSKAGEDEFEDAEEVMSNAPSYQRLVLKIGEEEYNITLKENNNGVLHGSIEKKYWPIENNQELKLLLGTYEDEVGSKEKVFKPKKVLWVDSEETSDSEEKTEYLVTINKDSYRKKVEIKYTFVSLKGNKDITIDINFVYSSFKIKINDSEDIFDKKIIASGIQNLNIKIPDIAVNEVFMNNELVQVNQNQEYICKLEKDIKNEIIIEVLGVKHIIEVESKSTFQFGLQSMSFGCNFNDTYMDNKNLGEYRDNDQPSFTSSKKEMKTMIVTDRYNWDKAYVHYFKFIHGENKEELDIHSCNSEQILIEKLFVENDIVVKNEFGDILKIYKKENSVYPVIKLPISYHGLTDIDALKMNKELNDIYECAGIEWVKQSVSELSNIQIPPKEKLLNVFKSVNSLLAKGSIATINENEFYDYLSYIHGNTVRLFEGDKFYQVAYSITLFLYSITNKSLYNAYYIPVSKKTGYGLNPDYSNTIFLFSEKRTEITAHELGHSFKLLDLQTESYIYSINYNLMGYYENSNDQKGVGLSKKQIEEIRKNAEKTKK